MDEPPLAPGVNATSTDWSWAVATRFVGADAAVMGMTAEDAEEDADVPPPLVAVAVKV